MNLINEIFGDKNSRSVNANRNTLFMFLFRAINILISFLYIPLLINSLSPYRYGIWLTITSIITWLNMMDIGLGNGLRNKLSEAIVKNNNTEAKYLISTAYGSISILSVIFVFIFLIASHWLNWSTILNVPQSMLNEVTNLVNLVFVLFSMQFTLSIINSILLAFQKPAYSTFITTMGQLLSFLAVAFSVYILHINSLFYLGLIISISPIIVLLTFNIFFFSRKYKQFSPSIEYIKFSFLKKILNLGLKFFILQIITIVLFQTCNIIIAQTIGQVGVTEYNIAYKYIGLIYIVYTIIVTPYWSATTDAYTRGDYDWIKTSIKKLNYIRLLFSVGGFILLLISPFIYKIWVGESVVANYSTLALALIYFIFLMKYSTYAFILNGIGKLYIQLIITAVVAVIFIPLTIFLAKNYGLNGVFISLIITSVINSTWSSIQYKKIIEGTATGLWIK